MNPLKPDQISTEMRFENGMEVLYIVTDEIEIALEPRTWFKLCEDGAGYWKWFVSNQLQR